MEITLSIIGIVIIGLVLFVITGLLGWVIQYLGAIVGFWHKVHGAALGVSLNS